MEKFARVAKWAAVATIFGTVFALFWHVVRKRAARKRKERE